MKPKFFICAFILSGSLLSLHAQIYTPDSIIQGSTGNNKVGIGTYQFIGDEKVNINGRLRIGTNQTYGGGHSLHIAEGTNTESAIFIHQAGVAAGYIGSKGNDPNLYITNDYYEGGLGVAAYSITIKNNGNVGIGTTDPQNKLDVYGTIRAQEIRVTSVEDWSDYVFERGYKLKSLGEVEKYITTNKHLPDVPSAKEVNSQGLNLGEMNAILLRKVEELTLYAIELNRKIEKLESEQKSNKK